MNRELVENILGVIKTSTDKTVIVKALLKLRTDVVKDAPGIQLFRDAGGVAPMVRLLHKPHEKLLEVVLSILGNCCTDEACCKQAFEFKCVPPLTTILKSLPNPIIQCRACRLLGNLAKSDCVQLLAVHCATIAQSLCQIIVETSDVQTRIMAFRACRFLLAQPQFTKHFLQANGFTTLLRLLAAIMKNDQHLADDDKQRDDLETTANARTATSPSTSPTTASRRVGLKKSQHREKYFEEVARNLECVRSDIFDYQVLKHSTNATSIYAMPTEKAALDLACEMLKCLLVISDLEIDMQVWITVSRSGCTYAPIVFFVTEASPQRSVALKILSNFTKNRGAFYMLSSSDAIIAACELLVQSSSTTKTTAGSLQQQLQPLLTESEQRYCINIIVMLSPDACNRSKIRRSGALLKLIAMLRESKSHTEISAILHLLNFFQYDVMSMELMLRDGLIPILIKELNAYLYGDDEYHRRRREERQQNSKKRKRLLDDANEMTPTCKFAKKRDDHPIPLDCDSPSSSPRSGSGISPASPCSSRSMSPLGSFKMDDAESDDETYSPICSDDDDDDDDANANANGVDVNNDEANVVNADVAAPANINLNNEQHSINNAEQQQQEHQQHLPPNNGDYSEIMKLLDIAARSETIEDNSMLDKDDDDEISQDGVTLKLSQNRTSQQLDANNTNSTIDVIENLLFRATQLINKRSEFGKPETLRTLVKAVQLFGTQTNFAGLLTNVLLESQFFAAVIKNGIAHQLYQLTKIDEVHKDGYNFLETLTCVGESNYGKSELARFLNTEDRASQTRAAIAVAYIIKNQRLLYQFLNAGNALSILFDAILRKKPNDYTEEAVDALAVMCQHTLNISLPHTDDNNQHPQSQSQPQRDDFDEYVHSRKVTKSKATTTKTPPSTPTSKPAATTNQTSTSLSEDSNTDDMCFMVHEKEKDDEINNGNNNNDTCNETECQQSSPTSSSLSSTPAARVTFRKQLLCDCSEVFNRMLNSDFRENHEATIHLHGYTVSGLRYFLQLIMRLSQHQPLSTPSDQQQQQQQAKEEAHTLLEAFEMSRVYIIPELEAYVQRALIATLDATNCLEILEWSMKNYHSELTEVAINYYLCAPLDADVKVKLFQAADSSKYATEWFQMLIDTVFERCRSGF